MTETLFIGRDLRFFDRLESTNKYAASMLPGDEWTEGTVIVADEQEHGRGRFERSWESEPGANLLCSILVKPHFVRPNESFLLSALAAVAVVECLAAFGIMVHIKWPNDVFHNADKVAGILIETQIRGTQISGAVVGIGLNINQEVFQSTGASSMKLITGRNFDRNKVLYQLCNTFEAAYLSCRANPKAIVNLYNECLYLRDQPAVYLHNDEVCELVLHEVLADGRVRARSGDEMRYFKMDELRLRRM